jgi:uncharacterized protein (TIGR02598 family)
MRLTQPTAPALRPQGFTLAESLFSVGIVAFVLLAIIATIPAAMNHLQEAERRTAESRIFRSIVSEYEAQPFAVQQQPSGTRYFDQSGLELPGNGPDAWYAAKITLETKERVGLTLDDSPFLKLLKVRITGNAANDGAFNKNTDTADFREYAALLIDTEPGFGHAL